jgi:hypothetical protein
MICEFFGAHEVGIAEPAMVFLEADPHRRVDVGLDEARRDINHADIVPSLALL